MQRPRFLPTVAIAAVTATLVLAAPLAASAHVRLDPGTAGPGAEAVQLTFSVPTESAKATTTAVEIALPTATPFADVSVQPVAGWSARVVRGVLPKPVRIDGTRVTEAPVRVIWTAAAGTKLTDGQFQNFTLSAGPVPDTGKLLLPATQRYSDGTVVQWNQPTPKDGQEPEHPAPTLYITEAPPTEGGDRATAADVSTTASASSGPALALSVAALVVALAGLALGLLALLRSRAGQRSS